MINSIKCELYKGFTQLKMVIFLIVMAATPIAIAIGMFILKNTSEIINDPELLMTLNYSNIEFPLHVLSAVVDLLIPIFLVILVADSITEDYVKGTLKLPLITPIKREKVLFSKMITIAIELIAMLVVLIGSSYVMGLIFFESSNVFEYGITSMSNGEGILFTILSYIMTFVILMVFVFVVFVIALHFKSTGSIIGITMGFIIGTPLIALISETVSKLFITNYFKFYSILFMNEESSEMFLGLGIVTLYGVISFILSYTIFKKKDILY